MDAPYAIEIYKQKYETFRHFDRLRWQLLQIAIFSSAGIVAFSETAGDYSLPTLFARAAVGVILVFIAIVMLRLRRDMVTNTSVLREAGRRIGDESIPSATIGWRNITSWIAFFFGAAGSLSLLSMLIE